LICFFFVITVSNATFICDNILKHFFNKHCSFCRK